MSPQWRWPIGRFKGVAITRTPLKYLQWADRNMEEHLSKKAREEIERRGVPQRTLEVSDHAIDKASTRFCQIWQAETCMSVGLLTWLSKRAEQALESVPARTDEKMKISHAGIVFVFDLSTTVPFLISVWWDGDVED